MNTPRSLQVGDGVSLCFYSDRQAATVVKVTEKSVHVQEDLAIRTDNNGMSDSQDYRYERCPEARIRIFTLRNNDRLVERGTSKNGRPILVRGRSQFYDYSF